MSASCSCCHDHRPSDPNRDNTAYRRVLFAVLAINATMFLVEIGAGVAAGSASLQADALDFFGDAANFAVSLFVIGMALRVRATVALVKGVTMAAFGLWVVGAVIWHTVHGTLPSAVTMGAVGVFGTGTGWPDLIVATIMAALALQGGMTVIWHSLGEMRQPVPFPAE